MFVDLCRKVTKAGKIYVKFAQRHGVKQNVRILNFIYMYPLRTWPFSA